MSAVDGRKQTRTAVASPRSARPTYLYVNLRRRRAERRAVCRINIRQRRATEGAGPETRLAAPTSGGLDDGEAALSGDCHLDGQNTMLSYRRDTARHMFTSCSEQWRGVDPFPILEGSSTFPCFLLRSPPVLPYALFPSLSYLLPVFLPLLGPVFLSRGRSRLPCKETLS